ECQLTEAGSHRFVVILCNLEYLRIRPEMDCRATAGRFSYDPNGELGASPFVLLGKHLSLTVNGSRKFFRQGVDTGHTHTVQATGHLVRVLVELATRVKHGHDNLQGRPLFLLVHVRGNTPAIILNAYGIVLVNVDYDFVAVPCERLIDRVIHHLPNKVMKPFDPNVPYIHRRPFPDGFQSL